MAATSAKALLRFATVALAPLAAGVEIAGCAPPRDSAPEPAPAIELKPQARTQSLIFITLDGVRRHEIFEGVDPTLAEMAKLPPAEVRGARDLLPNIHRLFFDEGTVLGDPRSEGGISASGPRFVSLPGYLEMMMGVSSGCTDNDCIPEMRTTIVDELAATMPPAPCGVFASWEAVARAAITGEPRGFLTISAGREEGSDIPPWPGHGAYRPDRVTASLALHYLREKQPRFLWISLGDTDEYAHHDNYPGYLEALRAADDVIGSVARALDEMGETGERATVIVTTDHDRSPNFKDHGEPGTGDVWLLARGPTIAAAGSIPTSSHRYLRDIAPTIRALFGLPARSCEGCGRAIAELLPKDGVEPPTFAAEGSGVRTALAPEPQAMPIEDL